jgi:hypothetical protein
MQTKLTFGKHQGKTVSELVFTQPGYISWILDKPDCMGALLGFQKSAQSLVAHFNAKPMTCYCRGQGCIAPASRASVYKGTLDSMYWCDDCNPYQTGANPGRLFFIRSYRDVLMCVSLNLNGRASYQVQMIRELARAKGAPERMTEKARSAFFKGVA